MPSNNHYNKKLKPFARKLRNNSTPAEIKLWREVLRAKQMRGYGFLRQRPIKTYIADFMCKELKLIIEVDGFSHQIKDPDADFRRDADLAIDGYTTLRFTDRQVMQDIDNVRLAIEGWIDDHVDSPFEGARGMTKGSSHDCDVTCRA